MTDGDSVTINNLRNSANGTFVTLDDYLPLTETVFGNFTNCSTNSATKTSRTRLGSFEDLLDNLWHGRPRPVHKSSQEFNLARWDTELRYNDRHFAMSCARV